MLLCELVKVRKEILLLGPNVTTAAAGSDNRQRRLLVELNTRGIKCQIECRIDHRIERSRASL
jgi:hypothetical protein